MLIRLSQTHDQYCVMLPRDGLAAPCCPMLCTAQQFCARLCNVCAQPSNFVRALLCCTVLEPCRRPWPSQRLISGALQRHLHPGPLSHQRIHAGHAGGYGPHAGARPRCALLTSHSSYTVLKLSSWLMVGDLGIWGGHSVGTRVTGLLTHVQP